MRNVIGAAVMVVSVGCSATNLDGLAGGGDDVGAAPPPAPACVDCNPPSPPPPQPVPAGEAAPSLSLEALSPIIRGRTAVLRVSVDGVGGPYRVHVTSAPNGVHVDDVVLPGKGSVEITMTADEEATEGQAEIVADASSAAGATRTSKTGLLVRGPSGALDRTFGKGGIVTTSFGEMGIGIKSIAILPSGKILAAGSGDTDFQVARYHADGTLDATFDGDGKATVAWPQTNNPGWTYATSLAILSDERFIVAGIVNLANVGLVRFQRDGAIDTSYADSGRLFAAKSGTSDMLSAATVDSEGRVVIAGYTLSTNVFDSMLGRYTPSGSPDSTFAGSGRVVRALSTGDDFANAVAVQSDGKIVAAGQAAIGMSEDATLVRTTVTGEPDPYFGTNGVVRINAGGPTRGRGVAIGANHIFVTGGFSIEYGNWLARVSSGNGAIDFCKKLPTLGVQGDTVLAMRLQPDGKVLLAGWSHNGSHNDFMVRRVLPDGNLDESFGDGGSVITDVSGTRDGASAIAVQPDGRIVAAGWADGGAGLTSFALTRYWP